jgi:RNA polymerase sigma-70 factor (ECF subfamily)
MPPMGYSQATAGSVPARSSSAEVASDAALLRAVAKGDRDAIRLLFVRHRLRVFRLLLRMVGNEAIAEELLNEVFLDVWRGAGRFEARSQVTTWIFSIARHKALTALRQRPLEALDEEIQSTESLADNPEAAAQHSDRSAILQDCLRQLSIAHREVIDLVYYHEQSIEQVARIIGVPKNTVKTRAFYARKRIAELMAARGIERDWL